MNLLRKLYVCAVVLCVYTASFSMPFVLQEQKGFQDKDVIEEKRPFDFSGSFYRIHGIQSELILNRPTGQDRVSVIDYINDPEHRNIRITGTFPAYSFEGETLYYNHYGDFFKEAFVDNRAGDESSKTAERHPIYMFPSETVKGSNRQAALIDTSDEYFEKNPLGLGVVVLVEYTDRIYTKEGQEYINKLAEENGKSLDGTPIINSVEEVDFLARRELITLKIRGLDDERQPSLAIARVIENPQGGAIAPDAFLMTVTHTDGSPLDSERGFVENFECLKKFGGFCSEKK